MSLPYENASSGANAMAECERILQRFGCSSFGTMRDWDKGELLLQFQWHERQISLRVSWKGYAAAWLKEHPYRAQYMKKTKQQHEALALEKGQKAVPSILRDWIKGQVTAVEVGLIPFDHIFMPYMLAHDGRTLAEHAIKFLPAPAENQEKQP